MLADMARHEPRLQIIFAAGRDPDEDRDRLAAIEVGDGLRVGRSHAHGGDREAGRRAIAPIQKQTPVHPDLVFDVLLMPRLVTQNPRDGLCCPRMGRARTG
jgi:hypothetical protein